MRIRKRYLYFLSFVLLSLVVLSTRFVFSQKPSFEIAPSPGPTIQDTTVSPALGLLGTIFTITTKASDVSGVGSVIAHLQNPDETDVTQITLYDDGLHSDGAANDGTYGNSWNSTGFPGAKYYIDIVATDTLGYFTENENGASFDIVANLPPTADARVGNAPNPTGKRVSVVTGDTVYFDGSTYSSDPPPGTITKYEWDFENDGIYDWFSATTGMKTHVYSAGSGYKAKLRVTDNDGATATDIVEIDRVLGCACEAWANGYCGRGEGVFDDDFETYNLGNLHGQGGWLELGGYTNWKVADTKAYNGVKSIYIDHYSGLINRVYKYGSGKSSGIQSAWIYFSDKASGIWILSPAFELISNYKGYWLNAYGIKFNISTGKWEFTYNLPTGAWIVLNPDVSKNVWHSIEAQFDEPNWRYKIRLDSGAWSDWIPFHFSYIQEETTAITGLRINASGQEVWADTIGGEIGSSCLTTQMSRNRTCTPAGCSTEFDCDGNAATCGAFFPPSSFDWSHKVLPTAPPIEPNPCQAAGLGDACMPSATCISAGGACVGNIPKCPAGVGLCCCDLLSPPSGPDWMSPVKNQGAWNVSTLFASVAVMEGKYNIQKNNPALDIDLSEQYMDACLQTSKLEYILRYTGGPTDEACLPYQAKKVPCSDRCSDWSTRLWDLTGVNTTDGNRDEIKYLLINKGPLRVTMDLTRWNSVTYSCGPIVSVNHVAVIVGYDDAEGVWIVRNSWGPGWNLNGYFKVKYGECLIDDEAVAIDGLIAP